MEWKDAFNYGLPSLLLFILFIGLWRLAIWSRQHIVEPIVKNHLKLIDTLNEHVPRQTEKISKVGDAISVQTKMLEGRNKIFGEIIVRQKTIVEKLDSLKKEKGT